jgi:hypothetical protein
MNTPLILVFILAAQSPQFYYDSLRQARNPFAPTTGITVPKDVQQQVKPQIEERVAEPVDPEMIVKLDTLKAVVITSGGKSVLYLGDEIVAVTNNFYGMPVLEITLDRIVLQNDHHTVKKVIGKPIELTPITANMIDEPPIDKESQE